MSAQQFGRYEIVRELGRGGMAVVYLAHDTVLGRDVALKVLPQQFMHDPSFLQRFHREARTVAALEHKAIIPLYDFGEHEGQPYLVMRYMSGGTLADRLRDGRLDLEEAAQIMRRICDGLAKAHAREVIHRDIKPGNILFDEDGQAHLSDFGIARLVEQTQTVTIIGTPEYMAPEQAHGHALDARTDVYQMGVLLFAMLSGRIPFEADTPPALLHQHAYAPIPSIRELVPHLPPPIERVIERAMTKSKEERFQTVTALAQAVEDVAAGRIPDLAQEPTVVSKPEAATTVKTEAPKQRRSWGMLRFAAIGALLLALGTSGYYFGIRGLGAGNQEPTATVPVALVAPATTAAPVAATASATETLAASTSTTSSPTPTQSPSPSPSATAEVTYRITANSAVARSGPGAAYVSITTLSSGDVGQVIGRTEDGEWLNVELRDGTLAWLAAGDGEALDAAALADVPVAATIPAPPVQPTAAATTNTLPPPTAEPTSFADRDGDGFADEVDDCPDEYGVADRGGCPFRSSDPEPPPPTATEVTYP